MNQISIFIPRSDKRETINFMPVNGRHNEIFYFLDIRNRIFFSLDMVNGKLSLVYDFIEVLVDLEV